MSESVVIRGDALRLPVRTGTVDLVITSPPYFSQRSYQDAGEHYDGQIGQEPTPLDFLHALWAVTAECGRALKPGGSMFVNLGDKYTGSGGGNQSGVLAHRNEALGQVHDHRVNGFRAPRRYNQATIGGARPKSLMGLPWRYAIGCIDQLGLILRAEIVWSKPNGLPESARDRVHRQHEQWFHFVKEPTYFADIDAVREPHDAHTLYCADWEAAQGGYERARRNPNRQDGGNNTSPTGPHPLGKVPGSVWKVATEPLTVPDHLDVDHFAAFPREWPRRLILGWSPANGVVLDPFGGSGTTAMVARALGRQAVSVDLSADYCRLARWRIFDSDGASRVRERTNREAQVALL